MANKDTSKQWFKTGDYPTQAQFYQVFDWLRWKDEGISIEDIASLQGILNTLQTSLNIEAQNRINADAALSERIDNIHVPDMDAETIKELYESNTNTNAFTDSEKTKLSGIENNATKNSSDAQLRDRSTHTGSQLAVTISDFAATVRNTPLTGLSTVSTTVITASDTNLTAPGKLQGQISNKAIAADIQTGTDLLKIPTAKSLADVYDNVKETVVAGSGVMNNQATATSTLRFTTTTAQVIIAGFAGSRDGKVVTVYNDTAFNISLLHNNGGASVGNRLFIQGLNNVNLAVGAVAVFKYYSSISMWVMIDLWGTDYVPTLLGESTGAVEVTPGGYLQRADIIEFETYLEAQTTALTKADLNALFPTFMKGQQVVCENITGGGKIYKKMGDAEWVSINLTKVV